MRWQVMPPLHNRSTFYSRAGTYMSAHSSVIYITIIAIARFQSQRRLGVGIFFELGIISLPFFLSKLTRTVALEK